MLVWSRSCRSCQLIWTLQWAARGSLGMKFESNIQSIKPGAPGSDHRDIGDTTSSTSYTWDEFVNTLGEFGDFLFSRALWGFCRYFSPSCRYALEFVCPHLKISEMISLNWKFLTLFFAMTRDIASVAGDVCREHLPEVIMSIFLVHSFQLINRHISYWPIVSCIYVCACELL